MKRIVALLALLPIWTAGAAQDLVITNARIIDGTGGVIEEGSILVEDGLIMSVGRDSASGDGARVDARGMTVMPGFIESHRHIIRGQPDQWMQDQAAGRMREFLEAGFTTVLSAGDSLEHILELRRRIDERELIGPTIIASGRAPLALGGGGFTPGVDPARANSARPPPRPTEAARGIPDEQTRARIQELAEAGVDAIKTNIVVSPGGPEQETLSVIAEEAERHGIPSITHAVSVEDMVAAVEARTHVLVHTPHIGQLDVETAKMVAESGIPMMSTLGVYVPTFAAENALIRARTGNDNIPRFRDLDPFPMSAISSAGQGAVNARMLWDAGVVYGYGTDTSFLPRDSLAHELKSLRLVFSAEDIVKMITRNAAAAVYRSDSIGTLEPGKRANIVIVDGDPLSDIYDLLNVDIVIKGGRVVVDNR